MVSTKSRKEHSPLGASSAERWMNCPGSNVLLKLLNLPESDETDFAKEGQAAHAAAAHCLREGIDTWEIVGQEFLGYVVDKEMADAVQLYLQVIRELEKEHGPVYTHLVEEHISDSAIHENFYGTVDDGIVGPEIIDVTDLKYGVGIAVDAIQNPQMKYYALGLMAKYMGGKRVRVRIVQPRAFHPDGPVREWETTTAELLEWRDKVLIPAMKNAEFDHTLTPGEWCRFCPAKLYCPMLTALYKALVEADPKALVNLTHEQLGMNYNLIEPAMIYRRAIEEEAFKRLNKGITVPGVKLVAKKSNRVFTAEGAAKLEEKFGDEAWEEPALKTPAGIDKLGPLGKSFTKSHAYSPNTGLTVAVEDDNRVGVKVQQASDAFAHYTGPAAASDAA